MLRRVSSSEDIFDLRLSLWSKVIFESHDHQINFYSNPHYHTEQSVQVVLQRTHVKQTHPSISLRILKQGYCPRCRSNSDSPFLLVQGQMVPTTTLRNTIDGGSNPVCGPARLLDAIVV